VPPTKIVEGAGEFNTGVGKEAQGLTPIATPVRHMDNRNIVETRSKILLFINLIIYYKYLCN